MDNCFLNYAPNTIKIYLPAIKYGNSAIIEGLLANEININMENHFGALVPDISSLTDLAQIFHSTNLPAWIGASAQAWKGTAPIKFAALIYFINWKPGLNYEKDLKNLAWMFTMQRGGDNGDGKATIRIHGGYMADFFANNAQQQTPSLIQRKDKVLGMFGGHDAYDKELLAQIGDRNIDNNAQYDGTVSVQIGERTRIGNLIMTGFNVTPSLVQVRSSQSDNPKPLFYKVEIQFQTCRAALEVDVDTLF